VSAAKDDAPAPIAAEVVRLWADLDGRQRIRRYRATVKVAYRDALVAPPASAGGSEAARKRARKA